MDFGWRSAPDPAGEACWELTVLPRGKGKERQGEEGEGPSVGMGPVNG